MLAMLTHSAGAEYAGETPLKVSRVFNVSSVYSIYSVSNVSIIDSVSGTRVW